MASWAASPSTCRHDRTVCSGCSAEIHALVKGQGHARSATSTDPSALTGSSTRLRGDTHRASVAYVGRAARSVVASPPTLRTSGCVAWARPRSASADGSCLHTGCSSLTRSRRAGSGDDRSMCIDRRAKGSSTRLSRNARSSRCAFGKSSTPTAVALATTAPNSDGRGTNPVRSSVLTGSSSVRSSACVPPGP